MVAPMHLLGLTGGIGCGKSTVAAMLAQFGVPVVDADRVSREVVEPGTEGLAEIVRVFGRSVLSPEGTLDRKKLAAVVFEDESKRFELNGILHPRIAARSAERLRELAQTGAPLAVYEAALLVENEAWRGMDGLVVVTARPEAQRARVMARDGISAAEADARVRAQWPVARKVAVATYVVDNSGGLERLRERVAALYAELALTYGAAAK